MGVLERLRYLLDVQRTPATVDLILDMLVVIGRHSAEVREKLICQPHHYIF